MLVVFTNSSVRCINVLRVLRSRRSQLFQNIKWYRYNGRSEGITTMTNNDEKTPMNENNKHKGLFVEKTVKVSALGEEFEVFYGDAGSEGSPVILGVHGAPATHTMFARMSYPLVKEGYRVVIPNLPGQGWTDLPPSGCYKHTTEHKAEVIKGFIHAMSFERVEMVFGHSMGAHTAAHLAASDDLRDKVQSVCLLSGAGARPHKLVQPYALYKFLGSLLYWLCHVPLLGGALTFLCHPFFVAVGLQGRTKMSQIYSVYEACVMNWEQFEKDIKTLAKCKKPCLVVHGDKDDFVEMDITHEVISKIGVPPQGSVWYKDGVRTVDEFKDTDLQRAVLIEKGGHFILTKMVDILFGEMKSLLSAVGKKSS